MAKRSELTGRSEDFERHSRELAASQVALVSDLQGAGFDVSSVWDLVNTSTPYPAAVPILFSHLDRDYPLRIREGIARALAVREARPGWEKLMRAYADAPYPESDTSGIRFAFSLALAAAADESVVDDLVRLAGDERNTIDRANFVRALGRMKSAKAIAALEHFADDPGVAKEAIAALRRKHIR